MKTGGLGHQQEAAGRAMTLVEIGARINPHNGRTS